MFSEKDFERLWFLYKTEGEPNGVSINSFCISNNIPYTAFYDWFKKTQKKVVPVEVEEIPELNETLLPQAVSRNRAGNRLDLFSHEAIASVNAFDGFSEVDV